MYRVMNVSGIELWDHYITAFRPHTIDSWSRTEVGRWILFLREIYLHLRYDRSCWRSESLSAYCTVAITSHHRQLQQLPSLMAQSQETKTHRKETRPDFDSIIDTWTHIQKTKTEPRMDLKWRKTGIIRPVQRNTAERATSLPSKVNPPNQRHRSQTAKHGRWKRTDWLKLTQAWIFFGRLWRGPQTLGPRLQIDVWYLIIES